ncbi:MAG: hypothetical protein QW520_01560, partial [Methanomassiliicoccales archaeon]
INVDDTALEAEGREIKARIDGKDVRITSDPLEVLSAEGSNPEDAVFCVRSAGGVSQLMIYVPSFSTHQIEISSIGPLDVLTSMEGALALVGAAALIIMAAIVLVRRRN